MKDKKECVVSTQCVHIKTEAHMDGETDIMPQETFHEGEDLQEVDGDRILRAMPQLLHTFICMHGQQCMKRYGHD